MAVAVVEWIEEGLTVGIWVTVGRGDAVAGMVWVARGVACPISVGRGVTVANIGLVNVTVTVSVVSLVGVTGEMLSVPWTMMAPTVGTSSPSNMIMRPLDTAAVRKLFYERPNFSITRPVDLIIPQIQY